ncbi:MAG: D-alanyl-D-alanine carboxypeptidase family protein [Blautia sp.]|nr:D-alanyl-D-alanine carboxypeptidase family protein [Blautia sp.]
MAKIRVLCVWMILLGLLGNPLMAAAEEQGIQTEETSSETEEEGAVLIDAPSGVLMEAETGSILFEKDGDTRRSPASITKIMTLILIFDALEKGNLRMEDTVTTSAHAKSMGGSQVFLEEGETQDVETMIKCIVIASGNDASVAMAEHICGSEQEFVRQMNLRAKELGMENTNFEDCCGLTDSPNHYTTARDIAVMSRELVTKYPKILEYSSVWMENITHVTKQGTKEFGLTNTNKLIRSYEGCVGLKTGSTSVAKYCLSAVARRNEVTLISVVMAAPDYKVRFRDAASMLNYGFSRCSIYIDRNLKELPKIPVKKGKKDTVPLKVEKQFKYLNTNGDSIGKITRKLKIHREVEAPVKKGVQAGEMVYFADGKEIGSVRILYDKNVPRITYGDCVKKILELL